MWNNSTAWLAPGRSDQSTSFPQVIYFLNKQNVCLKLWFMCVHVSLYMQFPFLECARDF